MTQPVTSATFGDYFRRARGLARVRRRERAHA
jgi:hypothetical protein